MRQHTPVEPKKVALRFAVVGLSQRIQIQENPEDHCKDHSDHCDGADQGFEVRIVCRWAISRCDLWAITCITSEGYVAGQDINSCRTGLNVSSTTFAPDPWDRIQMHFKSSGSSLRAITIKMTWMTRCQQCRCQRASLWVVG